MSRGVFSETEKGEGTIAGYATLSEVGQRNLSLDGAELEALVELAVHLEIHLHPLAGRLAAHGSTRRHGPSELPSRSTLTTDT